MILTFVVGELQGGVGTLALIEQGVRADCFVNAEPTDLVALTMHAAACDLIPRLNAMTFAGAASPEHAGLNRVHVGVVHGALGRDLHEWRPPQVADYVRLRGSGRYAPGQTLPGALADLQRELTALERRFPGLSATLIAEQLAGRLGMPPFEVARDSGIVRAVNAAYRLVRGAEQPTGGITPPGFYGTDAAHLRERAGMEGIVCGPGGRYNTMPDERVEIADYLDAVRIYLLTILNICEVA